MGAEATNDTSTFDLRIEAAMAALSPAEQRVATLFLRQKADVLLGSAAQIAALAKTSDATVLRTVKTLGFDSLQALREILLATLTTAPAPSRRLAHTLEASGGSGALDHVIARHEEVIATLKQPDMAARFERAVPLLAQAPRRHVFGIGPSAAIADYAALQFNRMGLQSTAMTHAGIGLADHLLALTRNDVVLMLAYAPLYREVTITLDEAERKGARVVLISDTLGPLVEDRIAELLPVPRGRTEHLAMHAGTLVLIEAMIIALAGTNRDRAIDSLEHLSLLRGSLDKDWAKRGVTRSHK
jgi:DNA-binding MurR/RpiR family transcriptional regulator